MSVTSDMSLQGKDIDWGCESVKDFGTEEGVCK
jgi:hypothetical protein